MYVESMHKDSRGLPQRQTYIGLRDNAVSCTSGSSEGQNSCSQFGAGSVARRVLDVRRAAIDGAAELESIPTLLL